jgi:hypothetical protein
MIYLTAVSNGAGLNFFQTDFYGIMGLALIYGNWVMSWIGSFKVDELAFCWWSYRNDHILL